MSSRTCRQNLNLQSSTQALSRRRLVKCWEVLQSQFISQIIPHAHTVPTWQHWLLDSCLHPGWCGASAAVGGEAALLNAFPGLRASPEVDVGAFSHLVAKALLLKSAAGCALQRSLPPSWLQLRRLS